MRSSEPDVIERLNADPKADGTWDMLVLAALEGPNAVEGLIGGTSQPQKPAPVAPASPAKEPPGAYLTSISVEGFRGIGAKQTLEIPTGPGLTLVVGRNGSGKSSFAEALELVLTGDTYRWAHRTKVWKQGWRNLHHPTANIAVAFDVEGHKSTVLTSRWPEGAALEAAVTFAQAQGEKQTSIPDLGWGPGLKTYRPILSYNELGSMLDEGPAKLYDALSAILGLEDLTAAQEALADARKSREKAKKEADERRLALLGRLRAVDDDRARALTPMVEQKDWGLDAVQEALSQAATGSASDSDLAALRQLANLQAPGVAVAGVVSELRGAHVRLQQTAGTLAAKSKDLADILDRALSFHQHHGDADCPVCGRAGALNSAWRDENAQKAVRLREAARDTTAAQEVADSVRKKALNLTVPAAEVLARATQVGLDSGAVTNALTAWHEGRDAAADLDALARHIESSAPALDAAISALRTLALNELQRREDRWKPIVGDLVVWLPVARTALQGAEAVKPLKAAETWLKDAASAIRNERFAPIREKAQQAWNLLRLQSNVALEDIELSGSSTRRQVDLHVTVDGAAAEALGVMSQGEQNALALCLFIPRATLPESPFRFVVIDDPVQSMDPSRIDGLARVLKEAAKARQVIVFTHDDRLPEAVRRLGIPAHVSEVLRRENSAVEVVKGKDPVARYIDDAMTVAYTDGLPPQASRRVIPGLCRLAMEAACTETVRRRRLKRGESHSAIEELLSSTSGTKTRVALALFDDDKRAGDVLPRLNKERKEFADAFRLANEGSHVELSGPMVDLVRQSEKLARWLQRLD